MALAIDVDVGILLFMLAAQFIFGTKSNIYRDNSEIEREEKRVKLSEKRKNKTENTIEKVITKYNKIAP